MECNSKNSNNKNTNAQDTISKLPISKALLSQQQEKPEHKISVYPFSEFHPFQEH